MNTFFISNDPFEDEEEPNPRSSVSSKRWMSYLRTEKVLFDWDGDALASAGFGTDEDYGGFSDEW